MYEGVAVTEPGAEVRFLKGYDTQGYYAAYGSQAYSIAPDEYCDSVKLAASLSWAEGQPRPVRLKADEPVYIWAISGYTMGQGPNQTTQATGCRNLVRFTPRAGHAYDVRQASLYGSPSCTLTVTDTTTGQPAEGAETVRLLQCRQRPRAAS